MTVRYLAVSEIAERTQFEKMRQLEIFSRMNAIPFGREFLRQC